MADKRKLHKCNKCIRTYTNTFALENHKKLMHSEQIASSQMKKPANKTKIVADQKFDRFQCPVCKSVFPSKFVAIKHIEVYHLKHKNNLIGPINPVKLKSCEICKKKPLHTPLSKCTCDNKEQDENEIAESYDIPDENHRNAKNEQLFCFLCGTLYPFAKNFYLHVEAQHNKHVETMFFPNLTQFSLWKKHIEKLAHIEYRLSSEEVNDMKFYHCIDTKVTDLFTERCPSIIVTQPYPKGILARLYKEHACHKKFTYNLAKEFRKYCVTYFLQSTDTSNGHDPYLDLKILFENIVESAAKINMHGLRQLVGKALEMAIILNTYEEENEDPLKDDNHTKNLSDAEITKALQSEGTTAVQEENSDLEISEPPQKKGHFEDIAPKIVNTFSLAEHTLNIKSDTDQSRDQCPILHSLVTGDDNDMDNEILLSNYADKNKDKPPITTKELLDFKENEHSSFNDTYRDFIRKNLSLVPPMVTRSRSKKVNTATSKKVNTAISKKESKSRIPTIAIAPKTTESLSNTMNCKETSNSINVNNKCLSLINGSTDCPVKPTSVLTTNVSSDLTPVVLTPLSGANYLTNDKRNMVLIAVSYAPTMGPVSTVNPIYNVVSFPQQITIGQETSSNNVTQPGFEKEMSPIKIKTEIIEDANTENTIETEDEASTDVDEIAAEDKIKSEDDNSSNEKDLVGTSATSDTDEDQCEIEETQTVKVKKTHSDNQLRKNDFKYKVIEQDSDCNILVLKL